MSTVDPSTFNEHERAIWFDGMRSGINQAAALAGIYNGQEGIGDRIKSAGGAAVDVLAEQVDKMHSKEA